MVEAEMKECAPLRVQLRTAEQVKAEKEKDLQRRIDELREHETFLVRQARTSDWFPNEISPREGLVLWLRDRVAELEARLTASSRAAERAEKR